MATEGQQVSLSLTEFRRLVVKQLDEAVAVKDTGNSLFKTGDLEAAEDKYHSVLEMIQAICNVPAFARPDFADLQKQAASVRVPALLNLAACSLKDHRFEDAVGFCDDVLKINGRNVKALYRLAQGRQGLGELEASLASLLSAAKLDPNNTDVGALLQRVRREIKSSEEREKQRFSGLFSRSAYSGARDKELEAEDRRKQKERGQLAEMVKSNASHSEVSLLERWVSSGPGALDKEEKKQLDSLIRRVAAGGGLEASDAREGFKSHGFGAAFGLETEDLEEDERERWQEQKRISEIKRITMKARQRHTLTPEETKTVRDYKEEEIERLRAQQRSKGLSQEERSLLSQLKESLDKEEAFVSHMEKVGDEVGASIAKLNSGQHMGPKERYQLYKNLEQEEKRLEALDDEHGLKSEELKMFNQLRQMRIERNEQKKARKAKHDYMKLMAE